MAQNKKRKYTLEIVFGGLVLVILLAIFIPSIFFNNSETDKPQSATKEGIDVPIEESDPMLGDENAPVTFVEFADYQCPSCKKSAEETFVELRKYIDQGKVRYVLKDFPLVNVHANALPVAIAVRAAGEQGKYWEMHDLVFAQQNEWSELNEEDLTAMLVSYAEQLQLDVDKFKEDLNSERLMKYVTDARRLGDELGVRYTPTLIVNGKMYESLIAPDALEEVIEEATTDG